MHKITFRSNRNSLFSFSRRDFLYLDHGDGYMGVYPFIETLHPGYFKQVHFTACKSYLKKVDFEGFLKDKKSVFNIQIKSYTLRDF